MRHDCRSKFVSNARHLSVGLLLGVSLLAISASQPALAQSTDFAVDISDPNVSIDLSVLNDGGLSPRMPAAMPAAAPNQNAQGGMGSGGYKTPGAQAPVSTLYIQPSSGFTPPPQTKTLIAAPAPAEPSPQAPEPTEETAIAEQAPMPVPAPEPGPAPAAEAPIAQAAIAEPVVEPIVEPVAEPVVEPMAAPPAPAEVAEQVAPEPEPEPVVQAEPEPTAPAATPAPTATQDVAKAEPVEAPVVAEPAPVAAPPVVSAPIEPKVVEAEQTPPPPPQALQPNDVAASAQAQSQDPAAPADAPAVKSGSVMVDLPPKLENIQPGVASLPSATGPLTDGDSMRIVFEHDSSKLPGDARDALKALSERMSTQDTLRLQLLAYAGDTETSASAARRLSLSRALAVRSYLIENGVRSTRIDVRALGNKSTETVTERVDITIVER